MQKRRFEQLHLCSRELLQRRLLYIFVVVSCVWWKLVNEMVECELVSMYRKRLALQYRHTIGFTTRSNDALRLYHDTKMIHQYVINYVIYDSIRKV